ncbi:hypothetical protein, unlikely [Trypanosoma brucei gambiense DAL972]|uniref:Uncharacterized protein n=1 Tax=Trypanosoma brucei gambiense (strain MHOM/CI/86/DAL972) TaxID=679716 RepID=C9ZTT7_TRYB9|nr:hypothetical protein, unlikely [Trypanosoma brucei gambiense DAL972]CBH12823.1 hypothetical protein, unlikely [Trypanosoma brucei gambiense DAL972]|eukprot:XP_011775102.1 hypothetical protein, unlikely [Trypanosoma brucei gambiense DAL972]
MREEGKKKKDVTHKRRDLRIYIYILICTFALTDWWIGMKAKGTNEYLTSSAFCIFRKHTYHGIDVFLFHYIFLHSWLYNVPPPLPKKPHILKRNCALSLSLSLTHTPPSLLLPSFLSFFFSLSFLLSFPLPLPLIPPSPSPPPSTIPLGMKQNT